MFGIDRQQYRALVRASLLMDFRGHPLAKRSKSQSPVRALVIMTAVQLFCSMALALGALRARMALEVLALAYSTTLCATAMLADYSAQLLLPDDADILAHRPIDSRTLFAARVTNVLFYVTLVGLSLNLPPAILGIAVGGLRFPLVFLPVAFLADYVATGAVLAVQALLLRVLDRERFKDVLAYVQGALGLLVFASYQFVPGLSRPLSGELADAPKWMLALPPGWFAGLVELGLGKTGPVVLGLSALAIVTSIVALPIALRRIASQYGDEPVRMQVSARVERVAPSRLARIAGMGLSGPARAGFDLAWAQLARERTLKMQMIPIVLLPIAMLLGIGFDRQARLGDPFVTGTTPMYVATYVSVMLLAFLTRYLRYSPFAEASWIFTIAPLDRPAELWRGARRALLFRLVGPIVLLLGGALAFMIPLLHALAHIAIAATAGLLLASLFAFGQRELPFSLPRQRAAGGRTLLLVFGTQISLVVFGGTHALLAWYARPTTLAAYAVVLALLALLIFRLADRRFARMMRTE
jgi:hypothetical protein